MHRNEMDTLWAQMNDHQRAKFGRAVFEAFGALGDVAECAVRLNEVPQDEYMRFSGRAMPPVDPAFSNWWSRFADQLGRKGAVMELPAPATWPGAACPRWPGLEHAPRDLAIKAWDMCERLKGPLDRMTLGLPGFQPVDGEAVPLHLIERRDALRLAIARANGALVGLSDQVRAATGQPLPPVPKRPPAGGGHSPR